MCKLLLTAGIAICLCGSAFGGLGLAQDLPRAEVFGGYSYLNADFNGLIPRKSANGWEASVSVNFDNRLAAEADVSGYYTTISNVGAHTYGFLGGPRLNIRPVFLHALFGVDRGTLSAFGTSASQNSFAAAVGGGGQWTVSPHLAVRVSADDAFTRHNIFGGPRVTQVNIRVSAGLVFMFGGRAPTGTRAPEQRGGTSAQVAATSEAALLGVAGYATEAGLRVTSVRAGSPAAQVGIKPGDVITKIDGRDVHSGHDVESAIAASASGTVRVTYLIKGAWLSEQEIKVR
jgi:hypothetical protein